MTYLGFDEASGCVKWGERLAERGVRPAVAPNASSLLDERDFRVDEAYAGKASRFAACLNFNSWVDFLGAVVALAHLDGVP